MGYRIKGFDFRTLQFLFGEVFVRNEYYFDCDAQSPLIVDCGAEIGFTMFFFKYLFPKSTILAFEPDPTSFALLNENIRNNKLSNVIAYNRAVSDKTGASFFYVDEENPGNLRMSLIKGRLPKKEIKVSTIRLSRKLKGRHVDYLKMDIEGYESIVLSDLNIEGTFKDIDQLGIEFHHHIISGQESSFSSFLKILEKNGYEYQMYASSFSSAMKDDFQDIMVWASKK